LAIDVNLAAFAQIVAGNAHQVLIENNHAVPFGFFTALTGGLVLPALSAAALLRAKRKAQSREANQRWACVGWVVSILHLLVR
jgi:hypothetical protein